MICNKYFLAILFLVPITLTNLTAKKRILSKKETIKGYSFPKDTELHFNGRGNLWSARIIHATQFKTLKLFGGEFLRFYPNGNLMSIDTYHGKSALTINGIPMAPQKKIYFHTNSNLKEITLAKKYKINQILFHPGDTLAFFPNGHLKTARIQTPTSIQGIDIHKYSKDNFPENKIDFFQGGSLKAFDAFTAYTIQGYPAAGEQRILFYPNGKVYRMKLSEDIEYKGKELYGKVETFFRENGVPDWQVFPDDRQELIWEEENEARVVTREGDRANRTQFRFHHSLPLVLDWQSYRLNIVWDKE
ncbi:MAG: hypothetical protein AAF518_21455, partial [Spirochaetota bacterium]